MSLSTAEPRLHPAGVKLTVTVLTERRQTRMSECTLHDSTVVKFKNRQNSPRVLEVRTVVLEEGKRRDTGWLSGWLLEFCISI